MSLSTSYRGEIVSRHTASALPLLPWKKSFFVEDIPPMLIKCTKHQNLVTVHTPYPLFSLHLMQKFFARFAVVFTSKRSIAPSAQRHVKIRLRFLVVCRSKDEEYDCYPCGVDDE